MLRRVVSTFCYPMDLVLESPDCKEVNALGISRDAVGVKAKTPEGMGTDNAAIAHVAVLLEEVGPRTKTKSKLKKSTRRKK